MLHSLQFAGVLQLAYCVTVSDGNAKNNMLQLLIEMQIITYAATSYYNANNYSKCTLTMYCHSYLKGYLYKTTT